MVFIIPLKEVNVSEVWTMNITFHSLKIVQHCQC